MFRAIDSRTADTPLVYTAMPGQSPIISGGQRLEVTWKPYRDGTLQADLPNDLTFDQLFVDGRRQHMARWPDYDPKAQYFQGFSANATAPQRVARWSSPTGGFVHAMHRSLWGDMHWRITGKTADSER